MRSRSILAMIDASAHSLRGERRVPLRSWLSPSVVAPSPASLLLRWLLRWPDRDAGYGAAHTASRNHRASRSVRNCLLRVGA